MVQMKISLALLACVAGSCQAASQQQAQAPINSAQFPQARPQLPGEVPPMPVQPQLNDALPPLPLPSMPAAPQWQPQLGYSLPQMPEALPALPEGFDKIPDVPVGNEASALPPVP